MAGSSAGCREHSELPLAGDISPHTLFTAEDRYNLCSGRTLWVEGGTYPQCARDYYYVYYALVFRKRVVQLDSQLLGRAI